MGMAGINKVVLVGNLGKDPELRYLENGTAVTKFPLATTETFKNKSGDKVSHTEWHYIVMWRGLAETAGKYLKKGMLVYIEGKIKSRSFTDKLGGTKHITEIIADYMNILTKKDGAVAGDAIISIDGELLKPGVDDIIEDTEIPPI
jgi:single-strand DNA-binding protein